MSGSCLYCQSPTENKSGACPDCRARRWNERTPTDWPTYLRCDECGADTGFCCRDDDDEPMLRPCGGRAFRAVTRCWACGTVVPQIARGRSVSDAVVCCGATECVYRCHTERRRRRMGLEPRSAPPPPKAPPPPMPRCSWCDVELSRRRPAYARDHCCGDRACVRARGRERSRRDRSQIKADPASQSALQCDEK
jgi:hypothetical protein